MSHVEIPLLRESAAFSARLVEAASRFESSRYQFHRRVNWSYRYESGFYTREAECFKASPDAYLSGAVSQPAQVCDVYSQKLRLKQVIVVLMKVLAHWLFHLLGRNADRRIKADRIDTYRKCYVDDIELVFDPTEAGVVRAVYPFPINLKRQLRYLTFLRRRGYRYKLAGNPYVPADVLRFILRRDVRSLMRLESRAQIRHARQVVGLGVCNLQLSDEFDIGSLDFCRTLARYPVQVINSAHGVGKYLPVHAYQEFHVVTLKQKAYYHAVRDCRYTLRRLNDAADSPAPNAKADPRSHLIRLVFLSQTFAGVGDLVADNESKLMAQLHRDLGSNARVKLFYKPHPNSKTASAPIGFERLTRLADVNNLDGTIFASFFSTCQIDPAFKGRKILVRGDLIHPEISFDDSEEILDFDGLVQLVAQLSNFSIHAERLQNTSGDASNNARLPPKETVAGSHLRSSPRSR